MIGISDFLLHPAASCGDCAYGHKTPAQENGDSVRCVKDPPRSRIGTLPISTADYPEMLSFTRACGEFISKERLKR